MIIIVLVCLMIGAMIGVFVMAMMNVASNADDEAERVWREIERGRRR